jgi:hypothetical protein
MIATILQVPAQDPTYGAVSGLLFAILLIAGGTFFYFLPSYIGRHKRNARAIFTLNLLAGWTLVGWIVAMVWATTVEK